MSEEREPGGLGEPGGPGEPGTREMGGTGGPGGGGGEGGRGGARGEQGERGVKGGTSRLALIGYAIMAVGIALSLFFNWHTSSSTHDALCDLRHDVGLRVERAEVFLNEHPGAEPIPGLTRINIQRAIDAQKRTVVALDDLEC